MYVTDIDLAIACLKLSNNDELGTWVTTGKLTCVREAANSFSRRKAARELYR